MTTDITVSTPIGDIVARDGRTATVFARYGIDFCCGGRQTLGQVCAARHVDAERLLSELQGAANIDESAVDVTAWSAGDLIDWIVNRHHTYVRTEIPAIVHLLQKAAERHGDAHPELNEVRSRFSIVADDLTRHMVKEERILFPAIAWLAASDGDPGTERAALSVESPLQVMEMEHEEAALQLEHIRELTGNFAAPPEACATWKAVYAQLHAFDSDLRRHVHLENHVLFPLARRLAADSSPITPWRRAS